MQIWLLSLLLAAKIEALSVRFSMAYLRDLAKPLNQSVELRDSEGGIKFMRTMANNQIEEVEVKVGQTRNEAEIFRNDINSSSSEDRLLNCTHQGYKGASD
jgi:hypothetical protein